MDSAKSYFAKTKTATCKLFQGIEAYRSIIKRAPVFTNSFLDEHDLNAQVEQWRQQTATEWLAYDAALEEYLAQSFAQATLSGSVLQIAAKAIECYGSGSDIQSDFDKLSPKIKKFCVGRIIRGVPIGLIIYAGRNQHMHFNEESLRPLTADIFKCLAKNHPYPKTVTIDPALDIQPKLSYASNVLALLGWRSYNDYERDMYNLLCSTSQP